VNAAESTVDVTVNCDEVLADQPQLWGHVNVSRRAPPPPELCAMIEAEFGTPELTRCWLLLDQMWDYRIDEYRFNYGINRDYYEGDPNKKRYGVQGVTTGLRYYDYIDSVSDHSKYVLLNIRRYEQEVLTGMITFDQWKAVFKTAVKHYKQRCPNLRYIEVLNEPTAKNQSNLGSMDNYYRFYRRAYEAINEINAELDPEVPVLVGGSAGFKTNEAIHLVRDYAKDESPDKRLDFLSFHDYWAGDEPARIAGWEQKIDRALAAAALPNNVPVFVTEIGYAFQWKGRADCNLWQACGMTAFQYFARRSPDLRLFPWVQYHSEKQIQFVQFDTDLRMTPFGAAVKMLRMHRDREVAARSTGLDADGNGLGALATVDDAGLTVQLWNLQPDGETAVQADVTVANLPDRFVGGHLTVRQYLIDTRHSNCFTADNPVAGLQLVEQKQVEAGESLKLAAGIWSRWPSACGRSKRVVSNGGWSRAMADRTMLGGLADWVDAATRGRTAR